MKTKLINRCECALVTMKRDNLQNLKATELAHIMGVPETAVGPVIKTMCSLNFLQKIGAASKTRYSLSDAILNRIDSSKYLDSEYLQEEISKFITLKKESVQRKSEKPIIHKSENELESIIKTGGFWVSHLDHLVSELKAEYKADIARLCSEIERLRAERRKDKAEIAKLQESKRKYEQLKEQFIQIK
jgi:hypothetical protein